MTNLITTLAQLSQYMRYVPLFVIFSVVLAICVGLVKSKLGWDTAYTRKLFHFGIFSAAAIIDRQLGLPAVLWFGGIVCSVVITACYLKNNWMFYSAIAREKDRPHQTLFIIIPMLSTAAGGLLSNIFFPGAAVFGYLVTGWGDAIAEPVGKRWGKHQYKVPTLRGVPAVRSLEGSFAVFLMGAIVTWLLCQSMGIVFPRSLIIALVCGMTGAFIEAVSNHGLDNLTIQVAVSAVAFYMI